MAKTALAMCSQGWAGHLGISCAWIGNVTALEPWRPLFIAMALGASLLAARSIWQSEAACVPGEVCAVPHVRRGYWLMSVAVALLVAVALDWPSPGVAQWFY